VACCVVRRTVTGTVVAVSVVVVGSVVVVRTVTGMMETGTRDVADTGRGRVRVTVPGVTGTRLAAILDTPAVMVTFVE
jgi:hypothetical protein